MKKILLTSIGFCLCLLGLNSIVQADVITDWNFSVNTSFVSWLGPEGNSAGAVGWHDAETHTNRTGKTSGISFYDDFTVMEWSSYDGKGLRSSSLSLDAMQGTIQTDGKMETAMSMVHGNQTVGNSNPTPKIMNVSVQVLLEGWHADQTHVSQVIELSLQLGFIETPNKGYGLKTGHTEDDIFFIVSSSGTTQQFEDAQGNLYDVSMDAVFQELTDVYLDTAAYYIDKRLDGYYDYDPSKPLYGWSTLENTSSENVMDVNIVVRHATMPPSAATPEPATWLIVAAAGALGLPFCRRNRVRKDAV